MQPRRFSLGLGQQQEVAPLRGVLGQLGIDQGVPAPGDRQPGNLGGPGADGLLRDDAPLVVAGERHALGPLDQVGGVGRLLEQGGPDGLEGGLGAEHGEEPEGVGVGVGVTGEGVGGGVEPRRADGVEVVRVGGARWQA